MEEDLIRISRHRPDHYSREGSGFESPPRSTVRWRKYYQTRRAAIWMERGRFGCVVILPKPELVGLSMVDLGVSNSGRLTALKASNRNWKFTLSEMRVFLITERSTLSAPSWRILP